MDIGIPQGVRNREQRASLTPRGVKALVQKGHRLFVESGAGVGAGHPDADYESAGARIVFSRSEALTRGELLLAVQPPEPRDFGQLVPGQTVLAFWHLALARADDIRVLAERKVTAIGLEAIEDEDGHAPVLTSMSEIAGVLGRAAARTALGMGAQVTLLDVSVSHLREALAHLRVPVTTYVATRPNLEKTLAYADLVLGAVAIHGERAPVLVTRSMLKLMKPRSVIMDLSIDMGGCVETSRPTSFPNPTYEVEGIQHFCVPNLPSIAARTSTHALTSALLPYATGIADLGLEQALAAMPDLRRGVYLERGGVRKDWIRETLGLGSD